MGMMLNDMVKCGKCENRAIVAGLCAGCASKELSNLRAASITTLVKCAKCENGVRPRYLIHGLCDECARSEISWLRHCIESWQREEKDWKAEEKRLREIEMAIRECPTATTCLGGVKALVYTTQLRDALEEKS